MTILVDSYRLCPWSSSRHDKKFVYAIAFHRKICVLGLSRGEDSLMNHCCQFLSANVHEVTIQTNYMPIRFVEHTGTEIVLTLGTFWLISNAQKIMHNYDVLRWNLSIQILLVYMSLCKQLSFSPTFPDTHYYSALLMVGNCSLLQCSTVALGIHCPILVTYKTTE